MIIINDFRCVTLTEKADMAFVDPPYNIGQDYGRGSDDLPYEKFVDFLGDLATFLHESLTPTGSAYVMMNDKYTDDLGSMLARAGFHRRRLIVWHETFAQYSPTNFSPCARFIHYVVKDPEHFAWTPPMIQSARQRYGDKRANPAGRVPGSVWEFPRVCGTFNEKIKGGAPNQLPLALLSRAILTSSKPGEIVLDCCAGNLTTGIAAKIHSRKYVLIEVNRDYVRNALPLLERELPCSSSPESPARKLSSPTTSS